MRTLAVSGWGQPAQALSSIAPDANTVDYAKLDPSAALAAIAAAGKNAELVIGWSLGGQLLVRSIAEKKIQPKKLVLISSSFQFVRPLPNPPPQAGEGRVGDIGMPPDTFQMFRDNYAADPARTLKKAWDLIAYQDVRESQVKKYLAAQDFKKTLAGNWLQWLDDLETFSCEGLMFEHFPPTLLIHGDRDAVVRHEQSERFLKALPKAKLVTFNGCNHAPHWHDAQRVQELCLTHAR